jgi:hypothetical protein
MKKTISNLTAYAAIGALTFVLMACAVPSQLSHYQLSALDKKITPEAVALKLQATPDEVVSISENGRVFNFHSYKMNNGIQNDLYLLAYENNSLLYWGYIDEFIKNTDASLLGAVKQWHAKHTIGTRR